MYARDQAEIERWCKNPDKVVLVGAMVLASIRMQWVGVGTQLARIQSGDLAPLWGWKAAGYEYLQSNKRVLYRTVRDLRAGRISERAFLRQWIKVPGLGLPKAGFVMQITCGKGGCLDMHNVERYGLDASAWQVPKRKDLAAQMQAIDDTINHYLSLCDLCGGTEYLWDEWCRILAAKVGTIADADDASRRHVTYLKENAK
jgi:hypothetical protein